MDLINEEVIDKNEVIWVEFLLMGFQGEKEMMETLHFCTMREAGNNKNDGTQNLWQPATHEYNINPFGKLLDAPAEYNESGEVIKHKSYFHGFFANIRCTEAFYDKWKDELDKYITFDENIRREHQPKWFV